MIIVDKLYKGFEGTQVLKGISTTFEYFCCLWFPFVEDSSLPKTCNLSSPWKV